MLMSVFSPLASSQPGRCWPKPRDDRHLNFAGNWQTLPSPSLPGWPLQTWVYPSEQMFYNAMKRKGWQPSEDDMAAVVAIHNAGAPECRRHRYRSSGLDAAVALCGPHVLECCAVRAMQRAGFPCCFVRATCAGMLCLRSVATPMRLPSWLLCTGPRCSERAGMAGDTAVGGGARRRGGLRRTTATQVQVRHQGGCLWRASCMLCIAVHACRVQGQAARQPLRSPLPHLRAQP